MPHISRDSWTIRTSPFFRFIADYDQSTGTDNKRRLYLGHEVDALFRAKSVTKADAGVEDVEPFLGVRCVLIGELYSLALLESVRSVVFRLLATVFPSAIPARPARWCKICKMGQGWMDVVSSCNAGSLGKQAVLNQLCFVGVLKVHVREHPNATVRRYLKRPQQ